MGPLAGGWRVVMACSHGPNKTIRIHYEDAHRSTSQEDIIVGRLTRDEEVSLARRIGAGDKAAEYELVTRNLRLVGRISKGFLDRGVDRCDLIQEGSIGLIDAARSFDPDRCSRFSAWAGRLIRQRMSKAVGRARPMRQLSEYEARLIPARVSAVEPERVRPRGLEVELEILTGDERAVLVMKFGGDRERSNREIAQAAGRSKSEVDRIKQRAVAKLRRRLNPEPEAA